MLTGLMNMYAKKCTHLNEYADNMCTGLMNMRKCLEVSKCFLKNMQTI